jgi:hypothetical protein
MRWNAAADNAQICIALPIVLVAIVKKDLKLEA